MSSANSELYEPVFKLSGISKSFDGRPLLKNINLDFYPGQICSILGENGAGKSTLIKIMAGILQPDEGDIFIQGNRVRLKVLILPRGRESISCFRSLISFLFSM